MSKTFFERPAAHAVIARILMQDARKQKCSKETTSCLIRQSGSEPLAKLGSALTVPGKVIVGLCDTGFKCYPSKGERIGFTLDEQSPLPTGCQWRKLT